MLREDSSGAVWCCGATLASVPNANEGARNDRDREDINARRCTEADAALLGKVTQRWFRHRLATLMLRKVPWATMEQGGWLDIRSVIGYSHDVPEYRLQLVAEMVSSRCRTAAWDTLRLRMISIG